MGTLLGPRRHSGGQRPNSEYDQNGDDDRADDRTDDNIARGPEGVIEQEMPGQPTEQSSQDKTAAEEQPHAQGKQAVPRLIDFRLGIEVDVFKPLGHGCPPAASPTPPRRWSARRDDVRSSRQSALP